MPINLPFSMEHALIELEKRVGTVYNTFLLTGASVPWQTVALLENELQLAALSQKRSPSKLEVNVFRSITLMLSELEARGAVARA